MSPRISVVMTAFQHERYIAQAIESVLAQQLDEPFELVIGDDLSSDATREVIGRYAERNPEIVRVHFPDRNRGGEGKNLFADALDLAVGEYVGMLDGDDYWTSPTKLRRQVAFLDEHPSYAMCFHNVLRVHEDDPARDAPYDHRTSPRDVELDELLGTCVAASCSPVFRMAAIRPLPAWYFGLPWGDWPLYVMARDAGRVRYLPEVLGAYRIHAAGMYSKLTRVEALEQRTQFYERLPAPPGREQLLRGLAANAWLELATAYAASGHRKAAWTSVVRSYRARPPQLRRRSGERLRLATAVGAVRPSRRQRTEARPER
jgi:glycosyltransferase involved in cell wall biosynthesis